METLMQKAIRLSWINLIGEEKYNKIKSLIDDNGYLVSGALTIEQAIKDIATLGLKVNQLDILNYNIRPKSLQGIENNNGWIRIETEKDFDLIPNGEYHWYDEVHGYYENGDIPSYKKYTHYQPIVKPEKPHY